MNRKIWSAAICLALAACGGEESETAVVDPQIRAAEIAHTSIIVDTHVDVPYRLEEKYEDVTEATEGGDFDYPRAVAGIMISVGYRISPVTQRLVVKKRIGIPVESIEMATR